VVNLPFTVYRSPFTLIYLTTRKTEDLASDDATRLQDSPFRRNQISCIDDH
jgi:hypothetical protein